jgi:hypothetical protein
MITRGKDKGEMGVIKRVIRSQNRVIVEGKNLVSMFILIKLIIIWVYLLLRKIVKVFFHSY